MARLRARTIGRLSLILAIIVLTTAFYLFLRSPRDAAADDVNGQRADDTARRPFRLDAATDTEPGRPCRNTVQGAHLITDDRGFICMRSSVGPDDCCQPSNTTYQYSCRGCVGSSVCCNTYEFCVSCCLRPEEQSFLQAFADQARGLLFREAQNAFDLCLSKCRTSSSSVVHENAYQTEYKYCVKASAATGAP